VKSNLKEKCWITAFFVITAISLPVFGQDTKYSSNQMEQIVGEELKHIPRGEPCSPQNFLRGVYHMMRMHDLSRANNGEEPKGKLKILKESIERVKRTYPDTDFVPDVDWFFL
jgi:hypothetical protein